MKLQQIINFLLNHGWILFKEGVKFNKYQPPVNLSLPSDYLIILPKNDSVQGFHEYAEGILKVLSYIYEDKYSKDNLFNHFSYGDELLEISGKKSNQNFDEIINNQTDWNTERLNELDTFDIELTI